jgi:formylglycine-generating enzyme required for sulfatase activity
MDVKKHRECNLCGSSVAFDEDACPNCGNWIGVVEPPTLSELESSTEPLEEASRQPKTEEKLDSEPEIEAGHVCPHCGQSHPVAALYCPNTGKQIVLPRVPVPPRPVPPSSPQPVPPPLPQPVPPPSPPPSKLKLWQLLGLILLGMAGLVIFSVVFYFVFRGLRPPNTTPDFGQVTTKTATAASELPANGATAPVAVATAIPNKILSPQVSPTVIAKGVSLSTPTVIPVLTITPALSRTVQQQAGDTTVSPVDGMEMVYVPAGEFLMGTTQGEIQMMMALCPQCNAGSLSDEKPQHKVNLDAYWIDKTEVTNSQFAQFTNSTGYKTTAEQSGSSYVQYQGHSGPFAYVKRADWQHPLGPESNIKGREQAAVTQISWDDAFAYCQWAGRRLPTEAEWEKAARGTQPRLFPWGNDLPDNNRLNFNYSFDGPIAVGSFPGNASPYGALDMAGNVWEWVHDFYGASYYQSSPANNPQGPKTGEGHVFRGGSWASELKTEIVNVTTVYRLWNYANMHSNVLGFRCAQDNSTTQSVFSSIQTLDQSNKYDLAFASNKDGKFSIILMNSEEPKQWKALPRVPGYETTWWPTFCGENIAVEVVDQQQSFPRWIFWINEKSGIVTNFQPPGSTPEMIGVPSCSPNGQFLAFSADKNDHWQILIADPSRNKKIFQLTDNRYAIIGYPSWNGIGDSFYWMAVSQDYRSFEIYKTTDLGKGEGSTTAIAQGKYPAVSPDGHYLAYYCPNDLSLCVMDLNSRNLIHQETIRYEKVNNESVPSTAMWSRDSQWVYFSSAKDGNWDIYRIHANGSDLENMTKDWPSDELMPALSR